MNYKKILDDFYEKLLLYDNNEMVVDDYPICKTLYLISYLNKKTEKYCELKNGYFDSKLNQLKFVLTILNENNIPYVLVKGVINAMYSFQNANMRNWNDIDILIDFKHISLIQNVLEQNKFIQGIYYDVENYRLFSRESKIFYITQTHQLAPYSKVIDDNTVMLDINFSISPILMEKKINVDEYISDRQILDCNGIKLVTLSKEKNLLYNILHCYKDITNFWQLYKRKGYRLKSFIDIYGYIRFKMVNLNTFRIIVNKYNAGFFVDYVLSIMFVLFNDEEILELCTTPLYNDVLINKFGDELQYTWEIPVHSRFIHNIALKAIENNMGETEKNICHNNKYYLEEAVI